MTRLRLLPILLLLTLATTERAPAQSAKDYFEPVVSRQQFTALMRHLELAREQRMIVEMAFDDYLEAIERLAAEADRKSDQAGRQTVLNALAGRAIVDPDELRRLRVAVLSVYEEYLPLLDREFEMLILGIEGVLLEDQRAALRPEVRALRRAVLLHPRHNERTFHEYAGDGVDVLVLMKEARAGGELDRLSADSLAPILDQYERELDALLTETAAAHRRSRMHLRKARIGRDARDLREAERMAIEQWERVYSLNERTVRRIGEIAAAELGPDARDRWLHRFHRACFEWMFSSHGPDRQFEWLMRQPLTEAQRQEAQATYDDYLAQRLILTGKAIALMIQARSELGSIIYSMMDPSELTGQRRNVYDDLLRNSGEMATLDAATSNAFEDMLDANQRRSFRNAFRRR